MRTIARVVGEYGLQHKRNELVVNFEYNLGELHDLLYMYPHYDGARKDIQAAIDKIEEKQKAREESERDAPRLCIVVCDEDNFPLRKVRRAVE